MFNAFSTALSALTASSVGVDAVGNNLANMNTVGYKASVVAFQDMVAEQLGGSAGQSTGVGVGVASVARQFTQGAIQSSSGSMDAAIQGNGFFVLRNSLGATLLSRAGNFQLDADGNLRTVTGEQVQGWMATKGVVDPNSATKSITIPMDAVQPPAATTTMTANLNLEASATVGQPEGTFSAPMTVVDSLGSKHVLSVTFTKTGPGEWGYKVSIPGADVTDGTAGEAYELPDATGTLTFDENGKLTSPAAADGPITIAVPNLTDGAADMSIKWKLYSDSGSPQLTQLAQKSALAGIVQDGATSSQITKLSMQDGGIIMANYSDGQQQVVAQLALATVRNLASLAPAGGNNYALTAASSEPVIGEAESGGRGKISGGALESSTADMAREFTNLIIMQRSYEANAKVITAADELSQATLNLRR